MGTKTNVIGLLGLILVLAGLFMWAIRRTMDPWSLTPLALGILLVLAYIFSNFDQLIAKMSGRAAREGLNSAIMILITLAIMSLDTIAVLVVGIQADIRVRRIEHPGGIRTSRSACRTLY